VTYLSEGLDLSQMTEITPEEISANLMHVYAWRGGTYEFGANALMLDYAPQFAKLHRWGADMVGRPDPVNILLLGIQNMASYVMLGWETGIVNQVISLRRNGMPKEQIMELIMLAQLYAGMRGLGHTFRAAALLARAWGITRTHAIKGVTASAMYFTSLEGPYTMHEAMADILEDWPET
jgi:hypothetical protein